ncbi:MAG TPA: acetoacetate--CoA ligase [Candidatus Eisenbacteria bacterium]|nr:acetoacetate--CoA ligase [Candidatus Eisenbacteria bacterium]
MGSPAKPAADGELLWTPPEALTSAATITRYMEWLRQQRGLPFDTYTELWRWSVSDLEGFWSSIWEFFDVRAHAPFRQVLAERRMPGARWFPGAELNYAEHALRRRDGHVAVVFRSESGAARELTYAELAEQVGAMAAGLRSLGVRRGDRVAAYLPNIPETLVAFLATASLGAVWSSCSPDFGIRAVVDRFQQIEPRVLFVVDGYQYGGKAFSRMDEIRQIQAELPSLEATVIVPYLAEQPDTQSLARVRSWRDLLAEPAELRFEPVPFDHPLWILYSSGTTGLPKAIVHGHGGIVLEHLKSLGLQMDLQPDDRLFWFTTTGWMMWNLIIGNLLLGSTVVLYDGSPAYPDPYALWRLAEVTRITCFGTSASYIQSCIKADLHPAREVDLSRVRALGSTGGPLSPEGFRWVYEAVKRDIWLGSVSCGTDVCTAFVGSCPLLPVHSGEIQCAYLGANVAAFDETGQPVVGEVGELVLTEPMPSMPLFFWNDPDGTRYRESYFETFPGVWRHGDWIKVTDRGSYIIYGRSDSTLKRGGVRMGTSEFYRVVAEIPEVLDSLVVDLGGLGSEDALLLFVVLKDRAVLDDGLKRRINQVLRTELSPRHVPDEIWSVPQIPTTLNGKKLEVPVKRILTGTAMDRAVSQGAVANPDALRFFVDLAHRQRRG